MSLLDIEGKDGVLKVDVTFKAAPAVETAVTELLFAIAAVLRRTSAVVEVRPDVEPGREP